MLSFFASICLPAEDTNGIEKDSSGITIHTNKGITKLEFFDDCVVRVIHSNAIKETSFDSLAIKAEPKFADWHLNTEDGKSVVQTESLKITVDKSTGRVRFFDNAGNTLLSEKNNGTTITDFSIGSYQTNLIEQKFNFDHKEALYGLGQHQNGVMNYSGHSIVLQQKNKEIAVPVVLSSKGYMMIWDNPAVTKVNFGVGLEEVIPQKKLLSPKGRKVGLKGEYFKGRNFEELVFSRIDSKIDFNWSSKPPKGMSRNNYSIRWTGWIEVTKAGEYSIIPSADDGVRLWIDGKMITDQWQTQPETQFPANIQLDKGRHRIKMEYFQGEFDAAVRLSWQVPQEPVTSWSSKAGDGVDYCFIYGPQPDKSVKKYRNLTGQAPLFPKWSWGFWQCKERYKSQQELLEILEKYRELEIPLDGIIQDWQYWPNGQWGSHKFASERYPDPAAMVEKIHNLNAHTIISVWPRFDLETENLAELEKAGAVYAPVYDNVYPAGKTKWYDPFNPKGRELYWNQIYEQLGKIGFDGWWLDACEAELGGDWGEMNKLNTAQGIGAEVYNAYPLLHTSGVYKGQRNSMPSKRVYILARAAYTGQQRNGVVAWSGDVQGTWDVLKKQIPAGLNFAATGIPYWNTDIGGFFGGDPKDPEYQQLFVRWFQYGAFCPMFRVHGTGNGKEVWRFDEASQEILVRYINLRYRLLPYIYSVSWKVTNNGYTMMRPLIMDFPKDRKVYEISDQYMFGPSIMVCPVVSKDAESRNVYLPGEGEWYNFWTGEKYSAGQAIVADASINRIPLFVRRGSIIPLGPKMQYVGHKPASEIELRIYAGDDTSFTLYEDQGDSYNYEKGVYSTIDFSWQDNSEKLIIGRRKGSYPGMLENRTFKIVPVKKGAGTGISFPQQDASEVRYSGSTKEIGIKSMLN
ncbi:TIM-barrel domain-containing protein [Sedimentisphaera salicampi]|uniref:glycoside hydrolase family 31 protein n=1 Tax=Sedimentisphaera salicampi TaxID=1941349 RepID=UPI00137480D7|nr:TIM-barrel domain-containing protein [Sedimentisphaera salicampi]